MDSVRGAKQGEWIQLEKRDGIAARSRSALVATLVLVLFGAILTLRQHGSLRDCLTILLLLNGVLIGSVFAHEIGHVAAAFAVGLTPFLMLVGGGPSVLRGEAFGVVMDIGSLPGGGFTALAGLSLPRMKWRLLFIYAAGPLVSFALLVAGLLSARQQWAEFVSGVTYRVTPAVVLVLVNGWLLFFSTLPFSPATDSSRPPSDLVQILRLPRRTAEAMNRLTLGMRSMRLLRLLVLRRHEGAFGEARRLLASNPDDWAVRLILAEMLIHARRYREAVPEYAALLETPGFAAANPPALGAALISNNYAWANFMLVDPQALKVADVASAKAMAVAPNHPSVLGTRGAVLVDLGRVEEGRKLLTRSLKLHREKDARANALSCLALASVREGRVEDARQLYKRASAMDSRCALLARVQHGLDALAPASVEAAR